MSAASESPQPPLRAVALRHAPGAKGEEGGVLAHGHVVGAPIPTELFTAVAELLVWLQRTHDDLPEARPL